MPPTDSCAPRNLELGRGTTLGAKLHCECLENTAEQSPPCGVAQKRTKLIFVLFIYLIWVTSDLKGSCREHTCSSTSRLATLYVTISVNLRKKSQVTATLLFSVNIFSVRQRKVKELIQRFRMILREVQKAKLSVLYLFNITRVHNTTLNFMFLYVTRFWWVLFLYTIMNYITPSKNLDSALMKDIFLFNFTFKKREQCHNIIIF